MKWRPIEEYELPIKPFDFDYPKALFYSEEDGIVIARCVLEYLYDDDKRYIYYYDRDSFQIKPTHWMPLPSPPKL